MVNGDAAAAGMFMPRLAAFGIYRRYHDRKVDPPVIGTRVMPEELVLRWNI